MAWPWIANRGLVWTLSVSTCELRKYLLLQNANANEIFSITCVNRLSTPFPSYISLLQWQTAWNVIFGVVEDGFEALAHSYLGIVF